MYLALHNANQADHTVFGASSSENMRASSLSRGIDTFLCALFEFKLRLKSQRDERCHFGSRLIEVLTPELSARAASAQHPNP